MDIERCYVYLRDILTGEWARIEVSDWADTYRARVATAVSRQMGTFGGELTLSGSPERGRVTLINAEGDQIIMDFDWYTLTVSQALGREPSGIVDVPQSVRRL
ncbi:hypothetical protein B8W67_05390 [Mycolicibacillus koreensis]|uniref:Uncharacterized protein n=1 Tax=Mycolicibacillus koreensis TaxID=1069220 RepID=A0AA91PG00_9MYCO|nr:hypothetical protein B8W67_05390 [Mycolicibacillus koreensis]